MKMLILAVASLSMLAAGACYAAVAERPLPGTPVPAQLSEEPPQPLLGKPAPKFSLDLLDGKKFNLADDIGKKVIVLDFWATWCPPCRASLPIVVSLTDKYKTQKLPVAFYGINLHENPEAIHAFLDKANLKFNVLLDADAVVARLYDVNSIPQSVIIGKDGTVQAAHTGLSPDLESRLKKELDTLTSGKNLVAPSKEKPPSSSSHAALPESLNSVAQASERY